MTDQSALTAEVKGMARGLGAELVGIASVDRFANAPSLPLPQTCYWRWRPYKSMS